MANCIFNILPSRKKSSKLYNQNNQIPGKHTSQNRLPPEHTRCNTTGQWALIIGTCFIQHLCTLCSGSLFLLPIPLQVLLFLSITIRSFTVLCIFDSMILLLEMYLFI